MFITVQARNTYIMVFVCYHMSSHKLVDLLVLEDDSLFRKAISFGFSSELSYVFVTCQDELIDYLRTGNALLYSLDDYVSKCYSSSPTSLFIQNYELIQQIDPGATVLYHGSSPSQQTTDFCLQHDVPMISDRFSLGKLITNYF